MGTRVFGLFRALGSGISRDFGNRKKCYGSDWKDIGSEKLRCVGSSPFDTLLVTDCGQVLPSHPFLGMSGMYNTSYDQHIL